MIKRALSLAMAAVTLYVYLLSLLRSDDALFLITSDSWGLNAVLLALAAGTVYLSFQKKLKHWQLFAACAGGAIVLSFVGMAGLAYSSLDNYFGGLIKPLDYLFILQTGIILGICSLSVQHQPVKLRMPSYKLLPLRILRLRNRLVTSLLDSAAAPARRGTGRGPRPA